MSDGGLTSVTREKLVEVLAFCFMPNHIHLLLRQIKDRGISLFMQKVGTGYASYFNTKNNRKGHLFQGKFKAVHIKDDSQLMTIFSYIHTNPLSLLDSGWKENGVSNLNKAMSFLEEYRWSSYIDCISRKNFPSVIDKDYLPNIFEDENDMKREVQDWIKYKSKNNFGEDICFE
ncbi:MAG: transposase [bacterium]